MQEPEPSSMCGELGQFEFPANFLYFSAADVADKNAVKLGVRTSRIVFLLHGCKVRVV